VRVARFVFLALAVGTFAAVWTAAFSQETHVWSDVDCNQSRIAVPAGFKCRATQEYSGGQGTSGSGAGGMFRSWTAKGTINNVRLHYYLHEAIASRSTIVTTATLEERIRQLEAKGGKNFGPTTPMAGADYVRYEGSAGQPCVGVRRYGPSRLTGFKWIMMGTRCVEKGKAISDQDVGIFIASVDVRS
jgi:hypothetical protein